MERTSMQATPEAAVSSITPIGYSRSSKCGYCGGGTGGSFSYYAHCSSISPELYQALVDRCWRRSGMLLYRPNQRKSCCPHYTIRLDADVFRPSRDQRQAVNRLNRYVLGDDYARQAARLYPRTREETRRRDAEFDLVERVHEAERANVSSPPEPAHRLTVSLEPDNYTEEKFAVFENYQRIVHKEGPGQITREGFTRFLCKSPLKGRTERFREGADRKLGSYHQCYRLDGKLVAVGVLDLLPSCVSGVYFFYHESVHRFSPGKFSALREIALAKEKGHRWWYPGFYIHSCEKMKYKIDYSPQYVLDPESYRWDLIDAEVLANFDMEPYFSMSRRRRVAAKRQAASETPGTLASIPQLPDDGALYYDDDLDPVDEDGSDDSRSLFRARMPGVPTLDAVRRWDMSGYWWCVESPGERFVLSDLMVWDQQDVGDEKTVKNRVAELAAVVGPTLMPRVLIDFSSST